MCVGYFSRVVDVRVRVCDRFALKATYSLKFVCFVKALALTKSVLWRSGSVVRTLGFAGGLTLPCARSVVDR